MRLNIAIVLFSLISIALLGCTSNSNQNSLEEAKKSLLGCAFFFSSSINDPEQKILIQIAGIARAHIDARENDKAIKLLTETLKISDRIDDYASKVKVMSYIAGGFARIGNTKRAQQILAQCENNIAFIKNDISRQNLLPYLTAVYAKIGNYVEAEHIAHSISINKDKEIALSFIAKAYAEEGQFPQAFDVLRTMSKSSARNWTTLHIGRLYINQPRKDYSKRLLSEVIEMTDLIQDNTNRIKAYTSLASCYAKDEQISMSENLLKQSSELTKSLSSPLNKAKAYAYIAGGYARCGYTAKARENLTKSLNMIKGIRTSQQKAWALVYAAQAQADLKEKISIRNAAILSDLVDNSFSFLSILQEIG